MATIAATASRPTPVRGGGRFVAILLLLSVWLPGGLAVSTVAVFLLAPQTTGLKANTPAVGVGLTIAAWLLAAIVSRGAAVPGRMNRASYGELLDRLEHLHVRLASTEQASPDATVEGARQEALEEVRRLEDLLELEPSASTDPIAWVRGSGYIDAWRRLHRAEEALLLLATPATLVADAFHDSLRLAGSAIEGSTALVYKLKVAVAAVDPAGLAYFDDPRPAAPGNDAQSQIEARGVLRVIRRTINEFRDDRFDGLVRARNRLAQTMVFTGLTAYAVLLLALAMGANEETVASAAAFYLIGAGVGLFSRLRVDSEQDTAVEDYGLSSVRLIHTPLVSGLAAIGGVVLTALLASPVANALTPSADVGAIARSVNLLDVVNVARNPFGLVISAVFGLTPGLLINRLRAQSEKWKGELQSTESGEGRPTG